MRLGRRAKAPDVLTRAAALGDALATGRPHMPAAAVERAETVVRRIDERLGLSGDHTVVALAGATGSGKSSLFNQIAGIELAIVGVRRPTTMETEACIWGTQGASALMDWLHLPSRHRITRESALDAGRENELQGLVLLDLPDYDSTSPGHREEVERLLDLVDVFVWVTDPQKYADAALHERYLRPLAGHDAVSVVVLNHADRLPREAVEECRRDLGAAARRGRARGGQGAGDVGAHGCRCAAAAFADLRGGPLRCGGARAAGGRPRLRRCRARGVGGRARGGSRCAARGAGARRRARAGGRRTPRAGRDRGGLPPAGARGRRVAGDPVGVGIPAGPVAALAPRLARRLRLRGVRDVGRLGRFGRIGRIGRDPQPVGVGRRQGSARLRQPGAGAAAQLAAGSDAVTAGPCLARDPPGRRPGSGRPALVVGRRGARRCCAAGRRRLGRARPGGAGDRPRADPAALVVRGRAPSSGCSRPWRCWAWSGWSSWVSSAG